MFLVMQDTTRQRAAETIAEGIARYRERFSKEPEICLVSKSEPAISDPPMVLTPKQGISAHNYFIGEFDPQEATGDVSGE